MGYIYIYIYIYFGIICFFCGGRGSNPKPCIFYALSLPTELSSRGQSKHTLNFDDHLTLFFLLFGLLFLLKTFFFNYFSLFISHQQFQRVFHFFLLLNIHEVFYFSPLKPVFYFTLEIFNNCYSSYL